MTDTDRPTIHPSARPRRPRRGGEHVVLTGTAVSTAFGAGVQPLLDVALAGTPGFRPVRRFDAAHRRVGVAAAMDGTPRPADELDRVIGEACAGAALTRAGRADVPLYLAVHGDPDLPRARDDDAAGLGVDAFAAAVARRTGLAHGRG